MRIPTENPKTAAGFRNLNHDLPTKGRGKVTATKQKIRIKTKKNGSTKGRVRPRTTRLKNSLGWVSSKHKLEGARERGPEQLLFEEPIRGEVESGGVSFWTKGGEFVTLTVGKKKAIQRSWAEAKLLKLVEGGVKTKPF